MAIFYMRVKNISRGSGRSAVAAAAYRAGEKLQSDYDGITSDYTKKTGILHSEIILPDGADEKFYDRGTLWNEVEKAEKADNARLAKEFVVAIPRELSPDEQIRVAQNFARKISHDYNVAVDLDIHAGDKANDFTNTHAHLLVPSRPFSNGGLAQFKERKEYALDANGNKIPILDKDGNQKIGARGRKMWKRIKVQDNPLDRKENMERWRANWAYECNIALQRNGIDEMIDHRSYERQGVDKIGQYHEGPAATAMRRRGKLTEIAKMNEQIQLVNCFRHALYRRDGEPRYEDAWSRQVWAKVERQEQKQNKIWAEIDRKEQEQRERATEKPKLDYKQAINRVGATEVRRAVKKLLGGRASGLQLRDLTELARKLEFEESRNGVQALPTQQTLSEAPEGISGLDWLLMNEFQREEIARKEMLKEI